MKAGKVWGVTELLLRTPLIEIHRLDILPNARCSMHCHEHKWNAFLVLKGELTIEVEKKDYPLSDQTKLTAGELMTTKPGEYHRFMSGPEPVEAIEIYYPEELSEDIIRRDHGGSVEPSKWIGLAREQLAEWTGGKEYKLDGPLEWNDVSGPD